MTTATAPKVTQPRLKGALVGAGNVSQFHLYAWQQIPEMEIVAIVDPNLERAQSRGQQAGIKHTCPSLQELLSNDIALDFVDIAAPPEVHVELVRQSAAHGLHILCQKPFAVSLQDAWQMIELAEQAGVMLAINENWRWRPWYRRLKDMLVAGTIGDPVYARVFAHADWWRDPTLRAHDHRFRHWERALLFDWGLHMIDIMRFLFGDPQTVYARLHSVSPALNADDYAIVVLGYDGMTALIDLAMSSHDPAGHSDRNRSVLENLRIEGNAGTLRLVPNRTGGDEVVRLTTAQSTHEEPAYLGSPHDVYRTSYITTQQHFIDCLRAGTLPETHARDNIETLVIMLAAYHSAETAQVVTVADFKRGAWQDFLENQHHD